MAIVSQGDSVFSLSVRIYSSPHSDLFHFLRSDFAHLMRTLAFGRSYAVVAQNQSSLSTGEGRVMCMGVGVATVESIAFHVLTNSMTSELDFLHTIPIVLS